MRYYVKDLEDYGIGAETILNELNVYLGSDESEEFIEHFKRMYDLDEE